MDAGGHIMPYSGLFGGCRDEVLATGGQHVFKMDGRSAAKDP